MKTGLIRRYFGSIINDQHGENYSTIIRYFIPEFITAFVLYSMPFWLDAIFIAHLKSTAAYATLGITNNLVHLIIKVGEAFSIGAIVLVGQFNGRQEFDDAGKALRDTFWVTIVLGGIIASFLYFGAETIYWWYGVPTEMAHLGAPFLQLRAVSVFFMFVYFAFVGFLRGIKNARGVMNIFVVGALAFVLCDYLLVFGTFGFPNLGLQGSAVASLVQYVIMLLLAIYYVFFDASNKKYSIILFKDIWRPTEMIRLLNITWPVAIDKATIALAYVWLGKMMSTLAQGNSCNVAAFCSIKDIERFSLVPAMACAQVMTYLVSNDWGRQDWKAILANIKRIVLLAFVMVGCILFFFALFTPAVISVFDHKNEFTPFASAAYRLLCVFVFFDVLQLLLSAGLRGVADVRTVMLSRVVIIGGFFVPVSYLMTRLPYDMPLLKFVLVYASFYAANAIMGGVYVYRLHGNRWKTKFH